ncbi:MAG: hypothetical protein ACLUB2_09285 [Butyricicoccus pullicaecorum]
METGTNTVTDAGGALTGAAEDAMRLRAEFLVTAIVKFFYNKNLWVVGKILIQSRVC